MERYLVARADLLAGAVAQGKNKHRTNAERLEGMAAAIPIIVPLMQTKFSADDALCDRVVLMVGVHATPVHAHDLGCSVASLKGTYAFRRTGVNNVVGGPIAQIGIDVFNGDGTRGLVRSTRSTNGEIRDWTNSPPSGNYTVDRDCTGAIFDADGAKTNNLSVLVGGKGFLLLSVAPETVTTEEGKRLEVED